MREIDFLPDWFKDDKKRKVNYRRQYVVIGAILAAFAVWNFSAGLSLSSARADEAQMQARIDKDFQIEAEFGSLQSQAKQIKEKTSILEELEPKVCFSAVIAEIGSLVPDRVILTNVEMETKKFNAGSKSSRVMIGKNIKVSGVMPEENTRLKVSLAGIADGASQVAELISELENSSYFCQIAPGYTRNKEINSNPATEFEVVCYLANYIVQRQD